MSKKHYINGPQIVPLEKLLQWKHYQYGTCWVKIKGIYYPFYTAIHIQTGNYTYKNTEDDLLEVLQASYDYAQTGNVPDKPRWIKQAVLQLERA